jgi:LacI family transcriptional regulator
MATLEEIGRLSGVSRSTVSRVLNNDPHVRESTRQRVLEVMAEHSYRPNLAARGLASGRTGVVGVVIPVGLSIVFADPFYALLLQGVSDEVRAHDQFVMLWLAEPEYERNTIDQVAGSGAVDGVIVISNRDDDPLVERLADTGEPFVLIGRPPSRSDISFVDVDNREAARMATTHLLRLGHTRVAMISGPADMVAGADRRAGYEDALVAAGLAPDPALVADGRFTRRGATAAMKSLLAHRPDAVFAASDSMALAAIREIQRAGLGVPDDVAVVGFDDTPDAAQNVPPLTTVRQPIRRLGSAAASVLLDAIADPDRVRQQILPTELVVRHSCGANRIDNDNQRKEISS